MESIFCMKINKDGSYSQVTVRISEDIPEKDCASYLSNLKVKYSFSFNEFFFNMFIFNKQKSVNVISAIRQCRGESNWLVNFYSWINIAIQSVTKLNGKMKKVYIWQKINESILIDLLTKCCYKKNYKKGTIFCTHASSLKSVYCLTHMNDMIHEWF